MALVGTALAARGQGYATTVTGAYLGGGAFAGSVSTPAKGKLEGKSIRRRCANRRRIESSTHDGQYDVRFRTTPEGTWQFWLPEESGRQIKVFVLAKRLPDGHFCAYGSLKIQEP